MEMSRTERERSRQLNSASRLDQSRDFCEKGEKNRQQREHSGKSKSRGEKEGPKKQGYKEND